MPYLPTIGRRNRGLTNQLQVRKYKRAMCSGFSNRLAGLMTFVGRVHLQFTETVCAMKPDFQTLGIYSDI